MQDELTEAKLKLTELAEAGSELEADLLAAIEAGDGANIIRLNDLISRNNIFRYAQKSKIIRLEKTIAQQDRTLAQYEKKILEKELEIAARTFEDRLRRADEARYAMNLIQVRLFSLDSRLENDRQETGAKQKELMEHVALWKQQAHKTLEATS